MLDAIRNEVPIQCDSYTCPTCGVSRELRCEVQRIDADGDAFSFEAHLICPKCRGKRTFFAALKEILKITKLEVKLNGISVERGGTTDAE
jgi:rubredoxin